MKKQILSLTLAALTLTANVAIAAEPLKKDPMNNDIFEVVATVKEEPENCADHGEVVDRFVAAFNYDSELDKSIYSEQITYSDGCVVTNEIGMIDVESQMEGYLDYATTKYPAYLEEQNYDTYVYTVVTEADWDDVTSNQFEDKYLVKKTENGLDIKLIASEEWIIDHDQYVSPSTLILHKAEMVDGVIKRTPVTGEVITAADLEKLEGSGSGYTDGVTLTNGSFTDINGNVLYTPDFSKYYSAYFNCGYLMQNANKGYSEEIKDYIYITMVKNLITGEEYLFENARIPAFEDNEYAIMTANNQDYIIKLKKPALVTVFLNNRKIIFDQAPIIENGRTLVPLRAIFEALDAEVSWNGETNTVTATKGETKIELVIDNTTANKNGEVVTLDVPAKVVSGRTLVPVRFIADCFGVDVAWDDAMQRVKLTEK